MWPIAFSIGSYQVGSYGLLIGLGILICLWGARTLGKRDGLDPRSVNDLGLGTIMSGLAGSMLLGVTVNFIGGVPMDWSELRNAGAIHGGLIGGLFGFLVLVRYFHLPAHLTLDAYVPLVALGQGIGRVGCFAAGCCFGRKTDVPWDVVFVEPVAHLLGGVPLGVHLHPVQLYDAVAHFALCVMLVSMHKRRVLVGRLFGVWCVGEGLVRLVMESYRGDLGRGVWFDQPWLSTGRITSSLFVVAGLLLLSAQALGSNQRKQNSTPGAA